MTIEEELFRKTKIDFDKISEYGFKKDKSLYKYSKNIMNNTFRVDIEINNDGIVKGKVYDLSFGDEYTNFRIEDSAGSFVGQVRDEFKNLLKDIRSNCFTRETFIYEQSNRITKAIKEKYEDEPYSSIMYKFKVLEVNIPYEYKDENLKMQKVMKIDLLTRYEKGKLSFNKLKDFGVNAIRSQRYMPLELSEYINKNLDE